jgi:hypothetical protein
LDISQKNIDIAQRSIELTQKNVEIAQKNLEAAQQGLQYASKANEISETGMQAANNTPTLDVRIEEVTSKRTAPGPGNNDAIEISYIIENNSDAPAPRVFPECFLETVTGVVDASTPLPDSGIAIMPRQPISCHATLFAPTGDPKKIAGEINDGKVGIRVYVRFFSALGKETRFIQTFYKNGGRFASTDMKFNPPPSEILKLIDQSKIKPSQH